MKCRYLDLKPVVMSCVEDLLIIPFGCTRLYLWDKVVSLSLTQLAASWLPPAQSVKAEFCSYGIPVVRLL